MEYKKGLMKVHLANSLKVLMLKKPFEKITIKNICDETGVIRATFYNYYEDKYDALNYIVYLDIYETILPKLNQCSTKLILNTVMKVISDNKKFYQIALRIEGQNAFEAMLADNIKLIIMQVLKLYRKPNSKEEVYSNEMLSEFYSEVFTTMIKKWLSNRYMEASVEDFIKDYTSLLHSNIDDFIDINEK